MENSSYTKINSIKLGGYYKKSNQKGGSKESNAIKLATFMVLFQHLLVERHYWYTSRSDKYKEVETQIKKILKVRNEYLKSKSLTVMDSTPYKEFIIRCTGDTIDQGREFRLGLMKRKAQGARLIFTYDPDGAKSAKIPEYKFANTSGNLDKNGVKKIFEK
jgi:hypothetical protein